MAEITPMTTDLWCPGTIRVPAPTEQWGVYADGYPARGVLHTTESDHYPPSEKSYFGGQVWPHSTIGEASDGRRGIFQHIPINRAARALKNAPGGVETNNAHAIQCEIVWRASVADVMPDWLVELVAKWMRFVEVAAGVRRAAPTFYGQNAGFTVASTTAKQRMTPDAWKKFDAWCGHQHVPENDHWDPGAIPIGKFLTLPTPLPPPTKDEDMNILDFIAIPVDDNNNKHWQSDGEYLGVPHRKGDPIGPQMLVSPAKWMRLFPAEPEALAAQGYETKTTKPFETLALLGNRDEHKRG